MVNSYLYSRDSSIHHLIYYFFAPMNDDFSCYFLNFVVDAMIYKATLMFFDYWLFSLPVMWGRRGYCGEGCNYLQTRSILQHLRNICRVKWIVMIMPTMHLAPIHFRHRVENVRGISLLHWLITDEIKRRQADVVQVVCTYNVRTHNFAIHLNCEHFAKLRVF